MNPELKRFAKKKILRMILYPLRLAPIKQNRVLMINGLACNYSDNPKYVTEKLLERNSNIEIIFSVADLSKHSFLQDKNIKPIKFNSLKYFYYAMTSKVLLTNSGGISYLPLRKKQYVINTWHGGGAYKKMGIDMYEDTPLFRKDLQLANKETNLVLVTNERFKHEFCRSMLTPEDKMWSIGMPRNDMLIKIDNTKKKNIYKKIGIEKGQHLVLFAPTYRKIRDNYFEDSISISYGIDEDAVCSALKERFGGEWIFAYRYHPCVTNKTPMSNKKIIDLTAYDDMQELLLVSDVLINDFSSCMWDFMLTKKPCFIFAKDLQHYIDTTDVYTPVSEWPFSKATSNEELVKNILSFDEKEYLCACKKHYTDLGGCETGKAAVLVADRIEELCKK